MTKPDQAFDTKAETAEFFRSREADRMAAGEQVPYFKGWAPNNFVNNHELHYNTYAFQARHGSDAYALFEKGEAALRAAGIHPQRAMAVHASVFTTSRELNFGNKDKRSLVDLDPATATRIERKAEAYCAQAEPFALRLTGRIVVMPNTLTWEIEDTGPFNQFLLALREAIPELTELKIHPKDPTKSPVRDREGAIALFQAAYGTVAYDFETVRAVAEASKAFEGATIDCSRIHRLAHTLSFEREGVSVPAGDLLAIGSEAPSHWTAMPSKIIEMQGLGADRGL